MNSSRLKQDSLTPCVSNCRILSFFALQTLFDLLLLLAKLHSGIPGVSNSFLPSLPPSSRGNGDISLLGVTQPITVDSPQQIAHSPELMVPCDVHYVRLSPDHVYSGYPQGRGKLSLMNLRAKDRTEIPPQILNHLPGCCLL